MKECKNCQNEFEPKHDKRGHEQMYCSIKCRTEAYKKRVIQKAKEDENKEAEAKSRISGADIQRADYRVNTIGNNFPNVNLEILEGKYQAKTEALEYKLRYEQAVKELDSCKLRIIELENELDDYNNQEDMESGGILGAIIDVSKNSPELGNAIGKLLQNDSIQNLISSILPKIKQN